MKKLTILLMALAFTMTAANAGLNPDGTFTGGGDTIDGGTLQPDGTFD